MTVDQDWQTRPVAVLCSGGLDSAVLVAGLARLSPRVQPIYVRFGLVWEPAEERGLRRYLDALNAPALAPLKVFEIPITEVYGPHWSTTGDNTPDEESDDEAVFLPGRTLLLCSQAAVWCHLQQIPTIALGILAGNPFPDSTDAFFADLERAVNSALQGKLRFVRPYRQSTKEEVLDRGREFPLGLTVSCIRPDGDRHCGQCNKCAERQRAFTRAGIADPTEYASA